METSHILYCEEEGDLIKVFISDPINKEGVYFYFTKKEALIISDLLQKTASK